MFRVYTIACHPHTIARNRCCISAHAETKHCLNLSWSCCNQPWRGPHTRKYRWRRREDLMLVLSGACEVPNGELRHWWGRIVLGSNGRDEDSSESERRRAATTVIDGIKIRSFWIKWLNFLGNLIYDMYFTGMYFTGTISILFGDQNAEVINSSA